MHMHVETMNMVPWMTTEWECKCMVVPRYTLIHMICQWNVCLCLGRHFFPIFFIMVWLWWIYYYIQGNVRVN